MRCARTGSRLFARAGVWLLLAAPVARAEGAPRDDKPVAVPPLELHYLQYGIAFTAEIATLPGPICATAAAPCILGSGGGIAARVGYRFPGPWYIGGAYEFSKQDPSQLYRLAILQQLRAEARYYFVTSRILEPYLGAGLGVAAYGNAWQVDVWAPIGSVGAGVELQITRTRVIGLAASYRLLYTSRFTDTSNTSRDPGVAQFFGVDLVLEARDPI